jgi:uncharacterized protein YggE
MRRLLTLLTALTLSVPATPALAQDTGGAAGSTLTVQGQATVSRPPEVASFSVGIENSDPSATAAQARNNALYDGVRAALARAGIPASAVKSSSYYIRYVPPPTPAPPEVPAAVSAAPAAGAAPGAMRHTEPVARLPMPINPGERYGYVVTRNLAVTTDPAKVGAAIDACVSAGATDVGAVSFDLRDRRGAWNAALAGALADADGQARSLANSGRFRIARLKSIQAGPPPYGAGGQMMFARAAAPGTEIPPSNVDVSASLTVTYTIAPR